MGTSGSLLLSFKEAAPILGITVWQIRSLAADGEIPVIRIGNRLYLRRRTIEAFVENSEGRHHARTYRRREEEAS